MSITGKAFSNPSSIAVTGLDTGQVPATLLLNETETSVTATCSAYGTQYITSCLDPTSTGRRQQKQGEHQEYIDLLFLSRQSLQNKQCFHNTGYGLG